MVRLLLLLLLLACSVRGQLTGQDGGGGDPSRAQQQLAGAFAQQSSPIQAGARGGGVSTAMQQGEGLTPTSSPAAGGPSVQGSQLSGQSIMPMPQAQTVQQPQQQQASSAAIPQAQTQGSSLSSAAAGPAPSGATGQPAAVGSQFAPPRPAPAAGQQAVAGQQQGGGTGANVEASTSSPPVGQVQQIAQQPAGTGKFPNVPGRQTVLFGWALPCMPREVDIAPQFFGSVLFSAVLQGRKYWVRRFGKGEWPPLAADAFRVQPLPPAPQPPTRSSSRRGTRVWMPPSQSGPRPLFFAPSSPIAPHSPFLVLLGKRPNSHTSLSLQVGGACRTQPTRLPGNLRKGQ